MSATYSELNTDTLLWLYRTMRTIRTFEEQSRREADAGKLRGMHSSIGQEAVPTGVCAHLRDDDYVLGTHRSHHHCIAKGVDLKEMMAELLGKATGTNKGKGGTMHIADINKGMLGANGVVGSNIPVATGVGLSAKVRGTDQVSVVFFGDGASSQGVLHESMNLASIWDLPVLFVCENNRYAESTPFEFTVAGASVANRAAGYDMPGVSVDGQDVIEMHEVAAEAVGRARRGEGPTLIEAQTYRYQGHFRRRRPARIPHRRRRGVLQGPRLPGTARELHRRRGVRHRDRSASAGRGGLRGRDRCDHIRRQQPVPRAGRAADGRVREVWVGEYRSDRGARGSLYGAYPPVGGTPTSPYSASRP